MQTMICVFGIFHETNSQTQLSLILLTYSRDNRPSKEQRPCKTPAVITDIEIAIVDGLRNFFKQMIHFFVRNVVLRFHLLLYFVKVVYFLMLGPRFDRLEHRRAK